MFNFSNKKRNGHYEKIIFVLLLNCQKLKYFDFPSPGKGVKKWTVIYIYCNWEYKLLHSFWRTILQYL